jgi:hypothetical protein
MSCKLWSTQLPHLDFGHLLSSPCLFFEEQREKTVNPEVNPQRLR